MINRDFLKDLGLEQETIDSIMAKIGKQHTDYDKKVEELQKANETLEKLKKENAEYQNTIKELNNTIETNNKSLESLQTMTNENKELKTQLQMKDSNVKKEFSKFVTSEIMAKVDEKNDFESVLKKYKEENPQYFGETIIRKVESSPELSGGAKPRTTNDIMNDIIRGSKE